MKIFLIILTFSCILLNGYNQNNSKNNLSVLSSNQTIEIGFGTKITATDLQIKKLTAYRDSDHIVFTLSYHSQRDRYLSFFTPPNGDIIKHLDRNGIKKNDTITTFRIARSEFRSVSEITMRFSINEKSEKDRNFIDLKIQEPSVKKLLNISKKPTIYSNIFSYYSSLIVFISLWLLIPLLLFIGNKSNVYLSVFEKRITNKWLLFNVHVLIFSVIIVILLFLVFSFINKTIHLQGYLYLVLIPILPANMVYFVENIIFKEKKLFWLKQYLNLVIITVGLIIMYKICNELSGRTIARDIISLYYVIISGVLVGFVRLINNYIFNQKILALKEKELEISRLNELKVRSDLNALQSKINPHFLYNALNSIAELCWENPQKAERMTLSLSKLFRYSINKEDNDFDFLKNEVEIVDLYMNIEKERHGNKLHYQYDYDRAIENILIPRFILQPLIENAVKHGIVKNPNVGYIKLKITKSGNQLEINVYDNGIDFPVDLISGYGLKSIYDKLDILYPKRYSIELHNGVEKNITLILKDDI